MTARDRLALAGATLILLGSVAALRGSPFAALTLTHALLAAVLALALVRVGRSAILTIAALLWSVAQAARMLDADQAVVLALMALAFSIAVGATLRVLPLPSAERSVLGADFVTIAAALVGIEWFALQQWADRSTSWGHVLFSVLLAVPAAIAWTHVIHAPAQRAARSSLTLGITTLVGFAIAVSVMGGELGGLWDLLAAVAVLAVIIGVARLRSDGAASPIAFTRWPSPLRLLPVLLVTLSLGMALGHGAINRWDLPDLVVAALLTVALIARQVLSFLEERRMALFIASQSRELRHQALHDPLTDLANRDLFYDRLEHALTLRQRAPAPLAVIHIDIHDFKGVNERYGHGTGDAVLVALADRIATWVRPADTVARLGGDEFAIIVDGSADAAMVVAQRLHEEIGRGFDLSGRMVPVDVSIGVATLEQVGPDAAEAASRLINEADRAMHQARRDRGGAIVALHA